jgi:hypothetical protein
MTEFFLVTWMKLLLLNQVYMIQSLCYMLILLVFSHMLVLLKLPQQVFPIISMDLKEI